MSTLQVLSTITLNLLRPNGNTVIYAKQYDSMSRAINATILAGDSAWSIPNGAFFMVRYAKPDGTIGFYDTLEDGTTPAVTKLTANSVQIVLASQALTASGNVMVDVNFFASDESRLTTFSFVVNVEKGAPSDDAIISNDYFNILDRKINAVIAATTHPPKIDSSSKNWLLWNEDNGQYVDSGYSSVGTQGPPGTITVSSQVRYQEGTSATIPPTGEWLSDPPDVAQGNYLWQREVLTFGDGTTATSYLVARQGRDGSGVGTVRSVNNINPDPDGNVTLPIDDNLSTTSNNLVKNSAIATAVADKIDKTAIIRAEVFTVSANGTFDNTLNGLTADYVVGNWGIYSDSACTTPIAENSPPCDITITTAADKWTLVIANWSSTFYLRPTFILKQN